MNSRKFPGLIDDSHVDINFIRIDDIPRLVEIHKRSFPHFFLSDLGLTFLREFYQGVYYDRSSFILGSFSESDLYAFAAVTTQPGGFYSRLLRKHGLSLGLAAVPAVIRHPRLVAGLLNRLVNAPDVFQDEPGTALLMSIAVLPEWQGKGIGSNLLNAFLLVLKKEGCSRVKLTTDNEDNAAVNAFYRKSGFTLRRTFLTPEGRAMNEYIIALDQVD